MENKILEAIHIVEKNHYIPEKPTYYCTQAQYDAIIESNMEKYFCGYRIVVVPSQLNKNEINNI